MPLLPAPQASEATWVPCPAESVVAALPSASKLTAPSTRSASSGWLVSAPVSMTATVAPAPVETSQAAGKLLRAAHHSTGVLGAVADRRLGGDQRRVVGLEARTGAMLDLDARHARVGAQAHGQRVQAGAAARAQGDEARSAGR